MRLVSLGVKRFGCIRHAAIELAPGLNLLHGPNDIGKSTLVQAVRAGLLLPHNSSAAKSLVPWQEQGAIPEVELTFQAGSDERYYHVRKAFGVSAELSFSNDGESFAHEASGRAVEDKLRQLLQWGVPSAGASRGMPESFLLKVLMASQPEVTAILGSALGEDKDESGRQRIISALEAMIEHPLFKTVLDRTTKRVSEAFSRTGQKRRGKSSPWIETRDRINAAESELAKLRAQQNESAAVLERVRQLQVEVNGCAEAVLSAKEELERAQARWARQRRIQELRERDVEAQERLEVELRKVDEAARAKAMEGELFRTVALAKEALAAAEGATLAAEAEAKRAEQRVLHLQSAGAAREAELKRAQLRERQTRLQSDIDARTREGELAHAVGKQHRELEALSARVSELEQAARTSEDQVAQLQEQLDAAAADIESRKDLLEYWRYRDVRQQLDQAEAANQSAKRYQQEASAQRVTARAIETELEKRALPTPSELAKLRELHHELQVKEAALNLGVTMVVTPSSPPMEVGISVDDGETKAENLLAAGTFKAGRSIQVALPGATVAVSVGAPEQVQGLRQLRSKWTRQGKKALKAAGATTLAELESLMREAVERRDEAAALRRSADEKDTAAAGLAAQASRLESLKKQAEAGERVVADYSLDELEDCARDYDDDTEIAENLRRAEAAYKQLEARCTAAHDELKTINAQLAAVREQVPSLQAAYDEGTARVGDWQSKLSDITNALQTLQTQKGEVETALRELSLSQDEELTIAKEKLTSCQTAVKTAIDQQKARQAELRTAEKALDVHHGVLQKLEETATTADVEGASQAAQLAKEMLAAAQANSEGVPATEDDVRRAQEALQHADAAQREKLTQLAEVRGGLAQVGGNVIEDRLTEATAELDRHQRELEELELEYGGWQLLEQTLRDAEKSEATNLGDKLGGPVQRRFAALTHGRYAEVEVGADLKTAGFVVAGETHEVGSLSAGTQEQLSTIFRLCLAEALETAVILDDHLSQTDSERMGWFRAALEEVSQKAQVIVITCWPEHYQPAGAQGNANWIDARPLMQRY